MPKPIRYMFIVMLIELLSMMAYIVITVPPVTTILAILLVHLFVILMGAFIFMIIGVAHTARPFDNLGDDK